MPEVTARGRMLYEYDEAAWQATDAVQATHPSKETVGRYIGNKSGVGMDERWLSATSMRSGTHS